MAPRGQKRVAQDGKKADGKKARGDTTMAAIEDVINKSELPQACRDMLLITAATSLETPSDKRHDIQTSVVSMFEELIVARETFHTSRLEEAKRAEVDCEAAQIDLVSRLATAEAGLAEKVKVADDKAAALMKAKQAVEVASNVLSEKQELLRTGDATLEEMQATKAALEKAIGKDLDGMKEGVADAAEIVPLLKQVNIDESLVIALPGTCAKAIQDRGTFDTMVLTQLETSLQEKLAEAAKKAEEAAPAAQVRAADVVSAEAALVSANSSAEAATSSHSTAEAERDSAAEAVQTAKTNLEAYEPRMVRAVTSHEKSLAALERFQTGTLAPFEVLRDATSSVELVATKAMEEDMPNPPISVGGA